MIVCANVNQIIIFNILYVCSYGEIDRFVLNISWFTLFYRFFSHRDTSKPSSIVYVSKCIRTNTIHLCNIIQLNDTIRTIAIGPLFSASRNPPFSQHRKIPFNWKLLSQSILLPFFRWYFPVDVKIEQST